MTMISEKKENNKKQRLIWGGIALFVLLALDQFTKYLAWTNLRTNGDVILIPGVFELHYLQNQGAAFGMFENMQWLFILFAAIISCGAAYFFYVLPSEARFRPLRILCIVILAGAIGNMIDRLVYHYVIDFLYFTLIDFPIFNVADIYVCCSTVLFMILILFYYKEDDFNRISGKKTKKEYVNEIIDKIGKSKEEE
ncbi:MAG: signal peptidase II [Lachnospiraceae bacterium]|nr:signal peptidase II [Lachnospiraceae bacterium]